MKRILVAVDDSEPSLRAARLAADIAVRFGAKLTLVHVVPPMPYALEGYGVDTAAIDDADRKAATAVLTKIGATLQEPGIEIDHAVLWGPPAELLADLANAPDVGMIVIGSRGRNGAARVLLGSTSDRLVHIAAKPVLVVR